MKKQLSLIALLLTGAMVFASCGTKPAGETDSSNDSSESAESTAKSENLDNFDAVFTSDAPREVKDFEGHFKALGRTSFAEYGQNVDYPGSGFSTIIETEGTNFMVTYAVEKKVYFASFIDGEEGERFEVQGKGTMNIQVPAGTHEVTLVRDGETKEGAQSILTKIAFDGSIVGIPEDKDLFIEVIGDSIVSGNGTLTTDNSPGVTWQASDNSATHAFGWMTAKELNADVSIIGRGSIGMVKQVQDAEGKGFAMPDLYKYATGLSTFTREEFDFSSARVPDIVILEVSTNDRSTVSGMDFEAAAKKFLPEIRTLYGKDMPIVWVYDLMIEDQHKTELLKVVEDLGGEAKGFYSLQLVPGQDGGRGTAEGSCHPSYENHKVNTDLIVNFLKEKGLAK